MTVRARLALEAGREPVGEYQFAAVPRVGEDLRIPCADDAFGVRIFICREVLYDAAGIDGDEEPSIELLVEELL